MFDDPRAAVFWKCIDIIADLGQRGSLLMFVLENVEGITKKQHGCDEPPIKPLLRALNTKLSSFQMDVLLLNTADFGLPHSRPRVYIVGRRIAAFPRGQPPGVEAFADFVALKDILQVSDNSGRRSYTELQKSNISDFKDLYSGMMNDVSRLGQFAVVDHSRTPTSRTKWSANRALKPDIVECLTASGPALHVFSLGEGRHSDLSLDRPLFAFERGRLQGFPETLCKAAVSDSVAKRMFGNAMSVPVLGSVLAREIKALVRSRQDSIIPTDMFNLMPAALHTRSSSSTDTVVDRSHGEASGSADDHCPVPGQDLPPSQDDNIVAIHIHNC